MQNDIIGIVGGMGPEAGISLSLHIVANTLAEKDQDHLPQILYSLPGNITDRTEYISGRVKTNPAHAISTILMKMEQSGAGYAAIACNSAHAPVIYNVIVSELEKRGATIKLLHMIEETGRFIAAHYPEKKRVGILGTTGTYQSRLYDQLSEHGLTVLNITKAEQENLHQAIYHPQYGIKSSPGKISREAAEAAKNAALSLIEKKAEILILGCTELPKAFMNDPEFDCSGARLLRSIPLVDSSVAIARALIKAHSPQKLKPWPT